MLKRILAAAMLISIPALANASIIFEQDFENGIHDYTANDDVGVYYNKASSMYITENNPYGNGTGMMGNTGYSNYANYNYTLMLDLIAYKDVSISFDYAGMTDFGEDKFRFFVNDIQQFEQSGAVNLTSYVADLSNKMVDGQLQLTWRLTSDSALTYNGFVFDNLIISGTPRTSVVDGEVSGPLSLAGLGLAFFGLSLRRKRTINH